jgi:hypothetical protein
MERPSFVFSCRTGIWRKIKIRTKYSTYSHVSAASGNRRNSSPDSRTSTVPLPSPLPDRPRIRRFPLYEQQSSPYLHGSACNSPLGINKEFLENALSTTDQLGTILNERLCCQCVEDPYHIAAVPFSSFHPTFIGCILFFGAHGMSRQVKSHHIGIADIPRLGE